MVYFDNNFIKIPRHSDEIPVKITITNEVTNEVTEFDVVDLSTNNHFYKFQIGELSAGTYRYNTGIEVGLLQVGDYVDHTPEYNEKKIDFVYE